MFTLVRARVTASWLILVSKQNSLALLYGDDKDMNLTLYQSCNALLQLSTLRLLGETVDFFRFSNTQYV